MVNQVDVEFDDGQRVMPRLLGVLSTRSPFALFLPFLILFIALVLRLHTEQMLGDEGRYYQFAKNMLAGFYSPPPPDINLWSAPGYPLLLVPFVALDAPLVAITLTNAVLHYLSIVLLFLTVRQYVTFGKALAVSLIWATYYIAYQDMAEMLSESLTLLLCTVFAYTFTRALTEDAPRRFTIAAGAAFGWLVLTKAIFGYVLLLCVGVAICGRMLKARQGGVVLGVFLVALLVNMPYLAYTYQLTGKVAYWSNAGGNQLYWMSTPFEGEFGDPNVPSLDANCSGSPTAPCNRPLIARNHEAVVAGVLRRPVAEQDDAFRAVAVENIRRHPLKYVRNWLANISRLFFGIPASYMPQREQTVMRIFPNAILLTAMLLSMVLTIVNWKSLPTEVRWLAVVLLGYLGLSSLVSAYPRHLYVVVPLVLVWCAYLFDRTISLRRADVTTTR
jgi:hypothetical protein